MYRPTTSRNFDVEIALCNQCRGNPLVERESPSFFYFLDLVKRKLQESRCAIASVQFFTCQILVSPTAVGLCLSSVPINRCIAMFRYAFMLNAANFKEAERESINNGAERKGKRYRDGDSDKVYRLLLNK